VVVGEGRKFEIGALSYRGAPTSLADSGYRSPLDSMSTFDRYNLAREDHEIELEGKLVIKKIG
jgi:hypothetical protein